MVTRYEGKIHTPHTLKKRKPREVRGAWIRCTLRCRIFLLAAFTARIITNIAKNSDFVNTFCKQI